MRHCNSMIQNHCFCLSHLTSTVLVHAFLIIPKQYCKSNNEGNIINRTAGDNIETSHHLVSIHKSSHTVRLRISWQVLGLGYGILL